MSAFEHLGLYGRQALANRILVVDDEPAICHLLRQTLIEEEYQVETATSTEEALKELESTPFDLAIVDLLLPGLNGLVLAEAIRMLDPHTPVILITAYGTPSFESITSHPAIAHYLHKPFNTDRLIELIQQHIPA
jgi:DNA-binding NtrC family response regulator